MLCCDAFVWLEVFWGQQLYDTDWLDDTLIIFFISCWFFADVPKLADCVWYISLFISKSYSSIDFFLK